jgi:hypothetical protein
VSEAPTTPAWQPVSALRPQYDILFHPLGSLTGKSITSCKYYAILAEKVPMSGAGTEDGLNFGIGERLYSTCLTLFSALSRETLALRDPYDSDEFNEELRRFYLWGEGFQGSKLDVLLGAFPDVGDSILRHLINVGTLLYDNIDFSKHLSFRLQTAVSAVKSSIEIAERVVRPQQDLEARQPTEDDGASDTSSSSRSSAFELLDDLHFYVGQLMNLIPSIDRSLNHVAKEKEQQHVDAPVESFHVSSSSSKKTITTSSKPTSSKSELTSGPSAASSVESRPDDRRDIPTANKVGATSLDPDPAAMTKQFQHMLSSKRLEFLRAERSTRHMPPAPQPPPYTLMNNLPILPLLPTSPSDLKFRNLLITLSEYPLKYENPGLLDEALCLVPLKRIYSEAEEEHLTLRAIAASYSDETESEWGYQDCVIVSLLR